MLTTLSARDVFAGCLEELPGKEAAQVEAATERGELKLNDGRLVLPAGVSFVNEQATVMAVRSVLAHSAIHLAAISNRADRWGRYRGHLVIRTDEKDIPLAEHLIAQGVALLHPEEVADKEGPRGRTSNSIWGLAISATCADQLLALEKQAQRAGLGIWQGKTAFPLDARNIPLLQHFEGKFVIVEGEVLSVGERRAMTFLNFGPSWRRDFSVMIMRKDWEKLVKKGITAAAIKGRRISVRGEILLREGGVNAPANRTPTIRISVVRSLTYSDRD